MQMLNILFLKMVERSLTAGIVILVVLFVRFLMKKLPKSYAYVLWIVVAFRLIIPISADSGISIFNLFTTNSWTNEMNKDKVAKQTDSFGIVQKNLADNINSQIIQRDADSTMSAVTGTDMNISGTGASYSFSHNTVLMKIDNNIISMMALVWIAGILVLGVYTVVAHHRIRKRIQYSIRLYDNIYACDNIRSPFVFGIAFPRIYLPFRLSDTELQCILAHERYHIRRKDYLVKSIAYMLVIAYWFHPLVWVAYHLMCMDMEMSCDEKIISKFTVSMRKEYSKLLLAFAMNKRQIMLSPLAFGEENTMKRIQYILNYKKPAQWKLAGGVAVIMLTMAACATDANTNEAIAPVSTTTFDEAIASVSTTTFEMNNPADSTVEHHSAQWAENSMCDLELCSLDYADSDKIVFHISIGLFQYDLQEQRITRSIDLKALNCQEVQTGGKCKVTVYQNSDRQLKAVIMPYPYLDGEGYIYDIENDELFAYDDSLLDTYTLFDSLISKYDLPDEERLKGWKHAEYILPLEDNAYGVLRWETVELVTMYYEAGNQKWNLFHKEQATLPKLLKQDDSHYQSIAMWAGKDIIQCELEYEGFYNRHDYAGVCALSTGLTYSDEMQQEFSEHTDTLRDWQEVSHSEDEKEYLYQYTCADDYGADGQKVYVTFRYLEGQGWRAEGLPTTQEN
ncbi:MAG: M56 family metallopeptidase [Lachnospiraceae bacterium]|nr:M56 family metallopeptidase [Lachnospiraceae bacterium]